MKRWVLCVLVGMSAIAAGPASAQEEAVRRGVILAITPVEGGSALTRRLARSVGEIAGRQLGTRTDLVGSAYQTQNLGADLAEAAVGSGTASRYEVFVQMADGGEMMFAQRAAEVSGLTVGSAVRIFGSGRKVRLLPDQTAQAPVGPARGGE